MKDEVTSGVTNILEKQSNAGRGDVLLPGGDMRVPWNGYDDYPKDS